MELQCTQAAWETLQKWYAICKEDGDETSSNRFVLYSKDAERYFVTSRTPQLDGAIVGKIFREFRNGEYHDAVGSFRIEPNGTVSRGPKYLRLAAQ